MIPANPNYSPLLSIIICAHNRKKYILEAIESVLLQTLDHRKFEIIVIKNFNDPDIDHFIDGETNIKSIYTDAPNLSNKQSIGIKESKGSYICFLDDDDLFTKERLEVLEKYFRKNSDISFIHNGMIFIDQNGHELQKSRSFDPIVCNPISVNKRLIKNMLSQMASYNPSSMAISRELALTYVDLLDSTFREVDTFWFACALDFGKKLMVIPNHLTKYRRHLGGLSRASDPKKILDYAKLAIENMSILEFNLKAKASQLFIKYKQNEWLLKRSIFNTVEVKDGARFAIILQLTKSVNMIPTRDLAKLILLTVLSAFSSRLAFNLYPTLYS